VVQTTTYSNDILRGAASDIIEHIKNQDFGKAKIVASSLKGMLDSNVCLPSNPDPIFGEGGLDRAKPEPANLSELEVPGQCGHCHEKRLRHPYHPFLAFCKCIGVWRWDGEEWAFEHPSEWRTIGPTKQDLEDQENLKDKPAVRPYDGHGLDWKHPKFCGSCTGPQRRVNCSICNTPDGYPLYYIPVSMKKCAFRKKEIMPVDEPHQLPAPQSMGGETVFYACNNPVVKNDLKNKVTFPGCLTQWCPYKGVWEEKKTPSTREILEGRKNAPRCPMCDSRMLKVEKWAGGDPNNFTYQHHKCSMDNCGHIEDFPEWHSEDYKYDERA